jgi:gliding motility associated protien GldN
MYVSQIKIEINKYKKMKRFYFISLILVALTFVAQAQTTNQSGVRTSRGAAERDRQQTQTNTGLPELSVRAQIMNEQMTQEIGNARWMRVMIRELDLEKEKNAPLYYPVQESNGMMNFFTAIFRLVSEGKVNVYRYLQDYESFEDNNILSFKDMLDNFNIYYDEIPGGGGLPPRYVINSSDIPSREVRKFFVKEAWYFDQNNSVCDIKTLALCPIGYFIMDMGEMQQPMFWVKYEDIRPYILNNYIMTSNLNNVKTLTVDDFFRRRLFDGDIIQTENLLNLPLMSLFETDEEIFAEQQRIESQLQEFRDSLWIKPDTTATLQLSRREARRVSGSARSSSSGTKAAPKEKEPKQPKAQPERAARTTPTRSIRR